MRPRAVGRGVTRVPPPRDVLPVDDRIPRSRAIVEQARALGLDADRFARDLVDPATAQAVADQRGVCMDAGARGTPSFFINGDLLLGSQAIQAFKEIIEDELAAAL